MAKSDSEWVDYCNSFFEEGLRDRRVHEKQFYLDLAYASGEQYVKWNRVAEHIQVSPSPSYRKRITDNQILPRIKKFVGKVTKNKPHLTVTPNTTEEKDRNSAKTGDKILTVLETNLELANTREQAVFWTAIFGTCFKKYRWDITQGELVQNPRMTTVHLPQRDEFDIETGLMEEVKVPEPDANGDPIIDMFYTGDVDVSVLSPFHAIPDPLAASFRDMRRFMHIEVRDKEWAVEQYGEIAKGIPPENVDGLSDIETMIHDLGGKAQSGRYTKQKDKKKEGNFIVKELWIWPNKENPRGLVITVAGKTLLSKIPWPYGKNKPLCPFVKCDYSLIGRFWKQGMVTPLRPLQKEWNDILNHWSAYRRLHLRGKYTVPKGSGIGKYALTNLDDEVVEYNETPNGGGKPEKLRLEPMPAAIYRQLDQIRSSMDEICHQHEASRGIHPPGVEPALMYDYMIEADDTSIGPYMSRFEFGEARGGSILLQIVGENYTEPRTLKLVGENGEWEAFDFMGEDLGDNYDVRPTLGSSLPRSRAAKQSMITQLWDKGILQEMGIGPEMIMETLEMGELERVYRRMNLDVSQAMFENRAMLQGQPMQVERWHEHGAHLEVLNKVRKSNRWYELDPYIQQIFNSHADLHEQAMQQIQAEQMQAQMAAQAGAGMQGAQAGMQGSPI